VAEEFQRQHGARLASELPGFSLPSEAAAPGEQDVLRTFSTEWTQYDWQGDTYWNKDADTWLRCMRFVLDPPGRSRGKLALEVGIGVGGVANDSSRSHESEVVGMDLGYGVDVAYKHFGENPWLHVVQASVFAPPFRDETFDFVYSFGVIHHTYDTNTAFRRVSRLPKRGGRLNIWVYSPQNERRSLLRRSQMVVERALRPLVWRLKEPFQTAALVPFVPAYVGHQAYKVLRGDPGEIMYGWREAVHAARDRLTPRYAHRHSEEEVSSWFDTAGYSDLQLLGKREAPQYVSVAFTAATGVDGIRKH
jgi:ubiquinone/menaquinone biosynthesis C-methylase UbiE